MKITRHELPDNTTVTIEVQHVYKNQYSACGVGYVSVVGKVGDKTYSIYVMDKNPYLIRKIYEYMKTGVYDVTFKSAFDRQYILSRAADKIRSEILQLNLIES